MALEIERRFLVAGEDWRPHGRRESALRQGYLLSTPEGLTLRVRTSHRDGQTRAWLTLKAPPSPPASRPASPESGQDTPPGAAPDPQPAAASDPSGDGHDPPGDGPEALSCPDVEALSRLEFEYPIPPGDAEAMLALTTRQVRKRRWDLDLPGGDWVLDVFEGANAPLVIAEVELDRPDRPVDRPPWCIRELTGLHQLSNAALALRPLREWSASERRELLGLEG